MISSPPKGRQTQKEKTEKDGIRVENVLKGLQTAGRCYSRQASS